MEIDNEFAIGQLIPDESTTKYPHIDYETSNFSNFSSDSEICVIMLTDQSKSIKIRKDKIKVELERIESFPQFVLSLFRLSYSDLLSDLKGTKVHKIYKRDNSLQNFHYSEVSFSSLDNLIELEHPVYVDIISTEVWVNSTIKINNEFTNTIITSKMKIDRLIKENNLQRVMLKTMITLWNHVYCIEDKKESANGNYKINAYLHFHYMITQFDFKLFSPSWRAFAWDKEVLNAYNIELEINATMPIFEESMFAIIQNQISKITIEKVNMLWNGFSDLKNFDSFITDENLENEFNTMKANVRSKIFNMGKEQNLYLYFSTHKIEEALTEYSSSSLIGFEKEKEPVNLIISPRVIDKKRRSQKKLKPVDKYIDAEGITISMPEIKKQTMDKVKVFRESPFEEPLISRDISSSNTQPINQITNSSGSKKSDISGYVSQKKSFEEVNTAAKKIYKTFEEEDEDSFSDEANTSKGRKKRSCCENFFRVLNESRNPSTTLSLSRQIKKMITENVIQRILTANEVMMIPKNELDKYSLPTIRNVKYSYDFVEMKESFINENKSEESIKKFNVEFGIVAAILVLVMIGAYFIIGIICKNIK